MARGSWRKCKVCGDRYRGHQHGATEVFCTPGCARRADELGTIIRITRQKTRANQNCSTCKYGVADTRADDGFVCGIAKALECRPWALQAIWWKRK